jgi:uncharacterized protein YbcI
MPDTQHDVPHTGRGEVAAEISKGAVRLLTDYTGRGPTKAHTVLNRESVTIVLRDTLTRGERSLVAGGKQDEVLAARHAYQEVMGPELTELVENATNRRVAAFLSANHVDPDVAVEFFLLAPGAETGEQALD